MLLLLAIPLLIILYFVRGLSRGDLVRVYPFMWPDSFDWMVNGIYWMDVIAGSAPGAEPTIRQPLVSLASGLALLVGAERGLLCAMVACVFLTTFVLWRITTDFEVRPLLRLFLVVALTAHFSLIRFSLFYMADQLTCLLAVLALREFMLMLRDIDTPTHQGRLWRGAALSAVACISQFYGCFPAIVAALFLVLLALSRRQLGLLLSAALIPCITLSLELVWRTIKFFHFGSFNATHVSHFGLLKLSLENLSFYGHVWPILFAPLIGAAVVLAPFARRPRIAPTARWPLAYCGAVVAMYASFVFIYQWQESRFTTYFLGIAFLCGALALEGVVKETTPRLAFVLAIGVACYLAVIPTNDLMRPTRAAYLHAATHPSEMLGQTLFAELRKMQPVTRFVNDPCLGAPSLTGEPILPGCDPYTYRNFQRYLFFRQRQAL